MCQHHMQGQLLSGLGWDMSCPRLCLSGRTCWITCIFNCGSPGAHLETQGL